jgi:hypothetical protein
VLFDECVFQNEGLYLGVSNNDIQIADLSDQHSGFGIDRSSFLKIRPDPVAEILGLANVNDGTFSILVEIYSWPCRQMVEFLLQRFRNGC